MDAGPLRPYHARVSVQDQHAAWQAGSAGNALFAQGRFAEAAARFREALSLLPDDVDLHYNLACASWATGNLAEAKRHLDWILAGDPTFAKAHDATARLHFQLHDAVAALPFAEAAVRLQPSETEFHLTHASVLEALGRSTEAWHAARAAASSPALTDRAASLCARVAAKLGREAEAVQLVHDALAKPAAHPAFRRQLHFAAATLLDRIGRYDEAFAQATMAHAIAKRPYDPAARRREFDRRINHWTPQRVANLLRATHGSTRPVFIVGMPRSGTSLVEQMLGCHPAIHAAGELDAMNRTAAALDSTGLPYPASLESLTPESAHRIAQVYLDAAGSLNATARYVTDKMPLNFMYLDLIQVLLPGSRVIHCVRDPFDTCVSCYLTDFAIAYDFATDLRDLGMFYADYRRLTDHWKSVLSLSILEVRYEDVVADIEAQARHMLDFLELPWDERCVRFHESTRPVITASRDQVRRPLYSSSVGRWKHYERHLGPLRAGLGEI